MHILVIFWHTLSVGVCIKSVMYHAGRKNKSLLMPCPLRKIPCLAVITLFCRLFTTSFYTIYFEIDS